MIKSLFLADYTPKDMSLILRHYHVLSLIFRQPKSKFRVDRELACHASVEVAQRLRPCS